MASPERLRKARCSVLLQIDRRRPLTEQIYQALSSAVRSGELRPGERLPASRRLASDLAVSRNTVIAAYQQLQVEGYVQAAGAAGTQVSRDIPLRGLPGGRASEPRVSDPGDPPVPPTRAGRLSREAERVAESGSLFAPMTLQDRSRLRWNFDYNVNASDPIGRRAWNRVLRRVSSRYEPKAAEFDFTRRPGALHEALVRHLRLTRGVTCTPEQIILTSSTQAALRLATRLILDPKALALVEDPHYVGARNTILCQGAHAEPVPVDRHGLCVDELPRRSRAKLIYTTPSHQWPTGVVQPLGRRIALLDWARRHDAWILENDHNCEYRYEGSPIPSIQGLDGGERVIYFGAFNRILSPPPAVGYAVVPKPLADVFRAGNLVEGGAISQLEQDALADFLSTRDIERLLRRIWRRARDTRSEMLATLRALNRPDIDIHSATTGLHVHIALSGWTQQEVHRLVKCAENRSVGVYPDEPFFMRAASTPGLILGFWGLSPDEIQEGVQRLGQAMAEIR